MISKSYPFLSIGIPTYKRPLRLKHILTTLANQLNLENADWEVVVSDNCSNDDTPNVVKSFENKLPITYLKHETNKGPDFNFRSLADSCKGEYLWFVPDDDDLVNESSVSKIISFIKNIRKMMKINDFIQFSFVFWLELIGKKFNIKE